MDNLDKTIRHGLADHAAFSTTLNLPDHTKAYVAHVHGRCSIRSLARHFGKHPSTVLRQVRRVEDRREDPLVDAGLDRLVDSLDWNVPMKPHRIDDFALTESVGQMTPAIVATLHHLKVPGTVLALAQDLDKAVVVRDGPHGSTDRLGIVERSEATAMALHDWIKPDDPQNRIVRYRITPAGRVALRECPVPDQPSGMAVPAEAESPRTIRYGAPETPLTQLARRKDRNGDAFLLPDMVRAGERLREDFELAKLDPDRPNDFAMYCQTGPDDIYQGGHTAASRAHGRVATALAALGPGLGDVAFSCCCALDGLEAAEKQLGWAARSGKIVLRIALTHLARHYENHADDKMIG